MLLTTNTKVASTSATSNFTPMLLANFKGIYAVLSRIWKCRKLRSFGANLLGEKLVGAYFYAFCNSDLLAAVSFAGS